MDISQVSFKISGSAGKASESLGKLITQLEKLDTAFGKVVDSGNATITMLNDITGALGTSAAQATAADEALSGFTTSVKSLSNISKGLKLPTIKLSQHKAVTKSTTTATNKLSKSIMNMGTNSHHTIGKLGRLVRTLSRLTFVTILTRQALVGVSTGFRAAINYTENLNLFMVALGENTTRAMGFVKEMSESFYLDEAQITRTLGLFYQISESLGLSSAKAYTLSTNFTKLAYDLASFYNITVDSAVTKLQAGLVGETEPLRRIGIIITENNLAETARNLGIRKSIRSMTEQEKIQLRYVTALQQTQNAQSDLARTMKQPENLLRIFNEQWQVLIRNLGSSFLPMLQQVMPHVIGITKALADMLKKFAEMRGYVAPMVRDDLGGYSKVVADESEKQAKSTSKTAKELGKILKYTRDISSATTGIDELNILGEKGGTAFDIGNLFETEDDLKASIDIELPDYDSAMGKAKDTFKEYVEMYDKKIKELWSKLKKKFTSSGEAFDELKESIKTIDFSDMDISVWDILNGLVTGVLKGITDIVEFGKRLYKEVFKPIMDLVAPEWMTSLQDGSFAEKVEKIFLIFVGYKALDTIIGIAKHLGKISTIIGTIAVLVATGVFDDTQNALKDLWASITGEDISLDEAVDGVRTALDIIDNVLAGVIKGMKDLVDIGKSLYKDIFKPIMDLVAPKWMESLEDGSFAEVVENIFLMFVGYKALSTITGIATQFGKISTIIGTISKLVAGGAVIKWVMDLQESTDELSKEELYADLINAILVGFEVAGLTGSPKAGFLAFGITLYLRPIEKLTEWAVQLEKDIADWAKDHPILAKVFGLETPEKKPVSGGGGGAWGPTDPDWRVEKLTPEVSRSLLLDELSNLVAMAIDPLEKRLLSRIIAFVSVPINAQRMMSELEGTSMSADNIKSAYSKLTRTAEYANGGKPTKGDLFVAGEKGPELVTEHNGQTIVMNEKQLAERGVSFFADGINVPEGWSGKLPIAPQPLTFTMPSETLKGMSGKMPSASTPQTPITLNITMPLEAPKKGSGEVTPKSTSLFKDMFKEIKGAMAWIAKPFKDIYKKTKEVIASIAEPFKEAYKNIKEAMEPITKTVKDIYKKIKDSIFGKAFTATIKGLGKATTALYGVYKSDPVTFSERSSAGGPTEDQKSMALGAMAQIPYLGQIIGVFNDIKSGAILEFFTNLPNFIEAGMTGFQDLLDGVINALPAILEQIPVIITKIAEMFSNKDTINMMIQSAIQIVVALVQALPAILQALVTAIPDIIMTIVSAIIENIPMFLKLGIVIGLAIIDGLVNIITGGINWLIDMLNKIPFVNIPHIPPLNLSGEFAKAAFADGGFPMQGQMFIAREAGAELVGNVGGRTAVMNNDQIVESVSKGVYEAMISAQQSDRGSVVVNLDGRKISNNQRRVSRTMGLDFGLGGF